MSEETKKNDELVKEGKDKADKATANAIKASSYNSLRKNHVVPGARGIDPIKFDKEKESGFVVIEFTKPHGTHDVGDQETYHHSTAAALVNKMEVAKVVNKLKKYVPKKENKT